MEQLTVLLTAGRFSLQREIAQLGIEIRRAFDQLSEQGSGTDRRIKEIDPGLRETSERIDELIVAIRAMIRRAEHRS